MLHSSIVEKLKKKKIQWHLPHSKHTNTYYLNKKWCVFIFHVARGSDKICTNLRQRMVAPNCDFLMYSSLISVTKGLFTPIVTYKLTRNLPPRGPNFIVGLNIY